MRATTCRILGLILFLVAGQASAVTVYHNQTGDPLGDLDFSQGADLSGVDLSYADLDVMILEDVNLSNANLSYAWFDYAILNGANLRNANLTGALMNPVALFGADLSGANLTNAHISPYYVPFEEDLPEPLPPTYYDLGTDFTGTGFDPVMAGWVLIPEPSTGMLLGLGLAGMAIRRRLQGHPASTRAL